MPWWPFGKKRRKDTVLRPQSAEPDNVEPIRFNVHGRIYTAPASAAPRSPVNSPKQLIFPEEPALLSLDHHDLDLSLGPSPFDDPPDIKRGQSTATKATNAEAQKRQIAQQQSLESMTALPKRRGIENSPHLRPIQEAEVNARSKRSANDASLLRRKSSKKRKENNERAQKLRAETMPEERSKSKTGSGAGESFLSRSFSMRKSRRLSQKAPEIPQDIPASPIQETKSFRSAETSASADRNRFEVGSVGLFTARPNLRYSMGPQSPTTPIAASNNSATKVGNLIDPTSPAVYQELREKKTVDSMADDLDNAKIRELLERDKRRHQRKSMREGEKARKKLDKYSKPADRGSPKAKSKRKHKVKGGTHDEAGPSGISRNRRGGSIKNGHEKRLSRKDIFENGDRQGGTDEIPQRANGKKPSPVQADPFQVVGSGIIGSEDGRPHAPAAIEDPFADPENRSGNEIEPMVTAEHSNTETTRPDVTGETGEVGIDTDEGEPLKVDIIERTPEMQPTIPPKSAARPRTSSYIEQQPLSERTTTEDALVGVPYSTHQISAVPVIGERRASGLSQATDGRSTPVEELARSVSRGSGIRRSGTLSAIFRRSGTGRSQSQDVASERSFSNTSRESMSRQPLPAHLVGEGTPVPPIRRVSTTLRTASRFKEDLPEYKPQVIASSAVEVSPLPSPTPAIAPKPLPETEEEVPEVTHADTEFKPPPVPIKSLARSYSNRSQTHPSPMGPPVPSVANPPDTIPERAVTGATLAELGFEVPDDEFSMPEIMPMTPEPASPVDSKPPSPVTDLPSGLAIEHQPPRTPPARGRYFGLRGSPFGDDGDDDGGSTVVTPRAERPQTMIRGFSGGPDEFYEEGTMTPQAQAGHSVTLEQIVRGIGRSPTIVYHQPRVKSNEGLLRAFDEYGNERDIDSGDERNPADDTSSSAHGYAASSHLESTQYDTASEGYEADEAGADEAEEPEEHEVVDVLDAPVSYGISHARTASAGSARILDISSGFRPGWPGTGDRGSHDTSRAEDDDRSPTPNA